VFFRLILVIPAAIVLVITGYGVAVLSFFSWLIALVAGRLPAALHQALAAVLRFQFRSSGYFFMLTGDYPWWGLFGDPVAAPAAALEPATSAEMSPAATDPWRLPLSGAAKGLVSGTLVLGLAAAAIVGVADAAGGWGSLGNSSSTLSNARSLGLIEVAQAKLGSSLTNFESAVQACGQLSCATAEDHKEAAALRAFASSVRSAGINRSDAADAGAVIRDANAAAQSLDKRTNGPDLSGPGRNGGGGGNRTRVLQYITRASPGAACCAFLSPGSHAGKLPAGSVAVRCPCSPRDRASR